MTADCIRSEALDPGGHVRGGVGPRGGNEKGAKLGSSLML